METFLNWWLEGENGVTYTPNGLAYTQSGAPLRDAANAAFIALAYGDKLQGGSDYYRGRKYACWGILQLRYILGGKSGKTSGGQSFMVSTYFLPACCWLAQLAQQLCAICFSVVSREHHNLPKGHLAGCYVLLRSHNLIQHVQMILHA